MIKEPPLKTEAFNRLCRTCLKTKDLFKIDDVQWEKVRLKEILVKWVSLEDNLEPHMPKQMCKSCIKLVYKLQHILEEFKKNEDRFKAALLLKPKSFFNKEEDGDDAKESLDMFDDDLLDIKQEDNDSNDMLEIKPEKRVDRQRLLPIPDTFMQVEIVENKDEIKAAEDIKELMYFCGTCQFGFDNNKSLATHRETMKHVKGGCLYVCPYCKKKTNKSGQFEVHLRRHRQEKPFVCSSCGKKFFDKGGLTRHVRNQHLNQKAHKCNFCYKIFRDIEKLQEHEKTHENHEYVCSVCGESFKIHEKWSQHIRKHRKDEMRRNMPKPAVKKRQYTVENGRYQCDICSKIYFKQYNMAQHLKEHEGHMYQCDLCEKAFSTKKKLSMHKGFVHTAAKFTCHICGHTVKCKPRLDNHIKRMHSQEEVVFNCEHCGKVFHNKGTLRDHSRIHTNDTKYQCQICKRICTNKKNLDAHLAAHTGSRAHECKYCGKKFATRNNLNFHIKSHTGPPTHVCSLCMKAFYMNCLLQKHMRNAHGIDNARNQSDVEKRIHDINQILLGHQM